MAVNETVNIRYVLSYIDRGIRRAIADDRQVREQAQLTGREMGSSAQRASALVRESFQAQRASTIELAQAYGVAGAAAEQQAVASRTSAAESVVALATERRSAAAMAAEYLALARTSTASAEEQAAAWQLYEREAVRAGLAVERANAGIASSHAAAGAAAARHSREERGFLAGTGLLGGRSLVFASTAFIGAAELGKLTRDIVDTTTQLQVAQAQVRASLQNTGQTWAAQGGQIEANIEHVSRATGFLRGPLLTALSQFIRVNKGDVAQSLKDVEAATELARGRNMELAQAAGIVTRAQIGMVTILRRQGISIKAVTTAEDALRDSHAKVSTAVRAQAKDYDRQQTGLRAVDQLIRQFGGNAARYMGTAAGATANYHRAVEDLDVELGRVLIPELTRGITHLTRWVDHLHDTGQGARDARGALNLINSALAIGVPLLRGTWQALSLVAHALGGWNRVIQIYIGYRFARFLLTQVVALGELSTAQVLATVTGTRMAEQQAATAGATVAATGAIEAEGVAATTTAGRLALLRTGLLRLAAIGSVAVGIDLLVRRHGSFLGVPREAPAPDSSRTVPRTSGFLGGIQLPTGTGLRDVLHLGASPGESSVLGRALFPGYWRKRMEDAAHAGAEQAFGPNVFNLRGSLGLLGRTGVGAQPQAARLFQAYMRALAGQRDAATRRALAPVDLAGRRVVGGARVATVDRLLGALQLDSERAAVATVAGPAAAARQQLAQLRAGYQRRVAQVRAAMGRTQQPDAQLYDVGDVYSSVVRRRGELFLQQQVKEHGRVFDRLARIPLSRNIDQFIDQHIYSAKHRDWLRDWWAANFAQLQQATERARQGSRRGTADLEALTRQYQARVAGLQAATQQVVRGAVVALPEARRAPARRQLGRQLAVDTGAYERRLAAVRAGIEQAAFPARVPQAAVRARTRLVQLTAAYERGVAGLRTTIERAYFGAVPAAAGRRAQSQLGAATARYQAQVAGLRDTIERAALGARVPAVVARAPGQLAALTAGYQRRLAGLRDTIDRAHFGLAPPAAARRAQGQLAGLLARYQRQVAAVRDSVVQAELGERVPQRAVRARAQLARVTAVYEARVAQLRDTIVQAQLGRVPAAVGRRAQGDLQRLAGRYQAAVAALRATIERSQFGGAVPATAVRARAQLAQLAATYERRAAALRARIDSAYFGGAPAAVGRRATGQLAALTARYQARAAQLRAGIDRTELGWAAPPAARGARTLAALAGRYQQQLAAWRVRADRAQLGLVPVPSTPATRPLVAQLQALQARYTARLVALRGHLGAATFGGAVPAIGPPPDDTRLQQLARQYQVRVAALRRRIVQGTLGGQQPRVLPPVLAVAPGARDATQAYQARLAASRRVLEASQAARRAQPDADLYYEIIRRQGQLLLRTAGSTVRIPRQPDIRTFLEDNLGRGISRARSIMLARWWDENHRQLLQAERQPGVVQQAQGQLVQITRAYEGRVTHLRSTVLRAQLGGVPRAAGARAQAELDTATQRYQRQVAGIRRTLLAAQLGGVQVPPPVVQAAADLAAQAGRYQQRVATWRAGTDRALLTTGPLPATPRVQQLQGQLRALAARYQQRVAALRTQAGTATFGGALPQVAAAPARGGQLQRLAARYQAQAAALRQRIERAAFPQQAPGVPAGQQSVLLVQARQRELGQLLQVRLRAIPAGPRRTAVVQALLDRFVAQVRAARDTAATRALAPQLVPLLPEVDRKAATARLQAAYVYAALRARDDINGKVWAGRLAALPPAIRAAVEQALRTQTNKRNKLALTALTNVLDAQAAAIDRAGQTAESRVSVRGLDQQSQAYFTAESAIQGGTIARLQALRQRLVGALAEARAKTGRGSQAAQHVRQALDDTQAKIEQAVATQADLARQAVTAAVDNAVQQAGTAVQRIQDRASQQVQLRGLDAGSPAAIQLQERAQAQTAGRLATLAADLRRRLAAARSPAVRRHVQEQLDQVTSDIDAAVAQHADLAHQAVQAAADQANTRGQARLQRIQDRLQVQLGRRDVAPDSPEGLRLEERAQRQSLAVLRTTQAQLRAQLGRTRAPAVRQAIGTMLQDISNQIATGVVQLGQYAREQVRTARQQAVTRASALAQRQQTLFERLQINEQLRGIGDTPAAGAEQAAFIRTRLIPGTRREITALQRQLRTAERQHRPAEEVAGIRQQLEEARNQLAQEQLDALNAIKQNTQQTVQELQGGLGLEFQGQQFTDQLLAAGTGL